ncbi:cyclin-dependent protein kinase inhibitor SMR6-like [Olea europaea var. sylvestris]|uniref:Cyclin-dependent protein kinase inhibitor SMR6 n=1 Tax=Olea europaea subsp. europaea TaxID=158383 RepID=A0A8S0UF69_OLEEU|nr:cyclin-dependent protein kinase inhibitor SMR6-like [Olea europaea var. sylvestris]CAA3016851.1 Hypothetical predicted protein [Olea europaea subsp. europaea]
MGFSKKLQVEGGTESESKKWLISGIPIWAPLKSISTKPQEGCEDEDVRSTTPTGRESRIAEKLRCPPAPRKRRPTSSCHFNGGRDFFNPPDLESVFVRHAERSN